MSSSSLTPDHVLIVDKRLVPIDGQAFHFIQLCHPRTQQEQSYAIDHQSNTLFEVIQCTRSHSSWFIDDQHVLPNGSLYIVTPINLIFLLLPSLWTHARKKSIPLTMLMTDSWKKFQLNNDFIREKLSAICDIEHEKDLLKLNEEKLIAWIRERIDRLKAHVDDEERAFDLICEYLSNDIVERCQEELKLHGNVRYEIPIGQKVTSVTTTTVTKKVVEVKNKIKRVKSTLYLLEKRQGTRPKKDEINLSNKDQDLSQTVIDHAKQVLFEHHLSASQSSSFREFQKIQNKSDCIFAKRARCWNAPHWLEDISVDENCERLLSSFILFCAFVKETSIDGYVIEIPYNHSTATIEDFGQIFKQILHFLSNHDPAKRHCMLVSPSRIGQKGWVFEFDRVTFFITTFLPHYPDTHPRYAHGSTKFCHILFQPELSFLRHNLSDDTPHTNWTEPTTSRDKIRVAFRDHGREYPIRPTIYYPPAQDMIRPLSNDLADIVEWWL